MCELRVGELFSDNMVLQQKQPINIWGTGTPGNEVSVEIQDVYSTCRVDKKGKWYMTISPLSVGRHLQIRVKSGNERIIINNVSVGEVFIAGGQSNMEFYMRYDKDFETEISDCQNEDIHFFDYPVYSNEKAKKIKDFGLFGYWRECNRENLQYYSAVAYYFVKNLQKHLKIPIGIIGCNCGGTRCCCWMDEESVEKYGKVWRLDYEKGLEEIQDYEAEETAYLNNSFTDKSRPFDNPVADRMMYGVSKEELEKSFQKMAESGGNKIGPWHEWRPSGLYHMMVQNIAPYTVKGVIWYQGESDEEHPDIFADMIEGLVKCWRREFKQELPFLMVELAPFGEIIGNGGKYYPRLRDQQVKAAEKLDHVYLVSSGDVGSEYDIHPKEKKPIGERLALAACGHIYQKEILCDAPVLEKAVKDDNGIEIIMWNSKGLKIVGDSLNALEIFQIYDYGGQDKLVERKDYMIRLTEKGFRIELQNSIVSQNKKLKISFAKRPYYQINLYNEANIPAMPFEIIL